MQNCRFVGIGVVGMVLCGTAIVAAQDFGRYREFQLGSHLAAISMLTGTIDSDVKIVHERPALIQELTWRPKYGAHRPAPVDIQSVEQIVFAFHDDRLFQVTIDYDQTQTEGLGDADVIEAVSAIYGSPLLLAVTRKPALVSGYGAPGTLIAQWGNADDSVKLYRLSSYTTRFRIVVTAEPAAALALSAATQAQVLDAREAPRREAAREQKEADARRAAEEKARATNKPAFRP